MKSIEIMERVMAPKSFFRFLMKMWTKDATRKTMEMTNKILTTNWPASNKSINSE